MSSNNLVITAADYYVGFHSALYILENHQRSFDKIIITATHPDRCEPLKDMGAEVRKVDSNKEDTYKEAFNEAKWILFYPEPIDGRVQAANRAIDAMKKADVKHVVMMSLDACECHDLDYVAEFKEIEEKMCNTLRDWVILRKTLLQNLYHLQGPYVMKHHRFNLPISKDVEFYPVHLDNALEASLCIMQQGIEKHRGQKYTLTGPEKVDGPKIAEVLNESVNSKKKIEFEEISPEDFKKYLHSIKNRIGEHSTFSNDKHQELLKHEFMDQPTDIQIHTLTQEYEWLKRGKAKWTGDLEKLTGSKGHKVHHFFTHHKEEFVSGR